MKARMGHALFALVLGGSILANARPTHTPAEAEQLVTAAIDIARSNDLTFRGRSTLANHLVDALIFDAKRCSEPIMVAVLSVLGEPAPLLEAQNPEGRTLRFVYYDRRWRTPSRPLIVWKRNEQAALAMFGLTRFVPSKYMLAITASSDCKAADTIDWQNAWDRRYLASLAPDQAAPEPR
jgi:hypothetical protein